MVNTNKPPYFVSNTRILERESHYIRASMVNINLKKTILMSRSNAVVIVTRLRG
jgi:hypothetical protein